MTFSNPQCTDCKHLDREREKGFVCAAFPQGVPFDIITNTFQHTKKHPDQDNDILFEEMEKP